MFRSESRRPRMANGRYFILAMLLLIVGGFEQLAIAQDDVIDARLADARETYHSEVAECRRSMETDFERRLASARKKGALELVRSIESERTATEGTALVAANAPDRLKLRLRRAETSFESSLKNAAREYVRIGQDKNAAGVEIELAKFRASLQPPQKQGVASVAQTLPVQETIDLLSMVKLPAHAVRGNWSRGDDFVSCERMYNTRCMLPVAIQGSYTLRCRFTRRVGTDYVGVVLPVESRQCYLVVSAYGGTLSGIGQIDGKNLPELVGTSAVTKSTANPIPNGVVQELVAVVTVRKTGCSITASLNGTVFARWSGDPSTLSAPGEHSVPSPRSPAIGCYDCIADFHEVELKLDKGAKGYRLTDEWDCPLLEQAAAPPKEWSGKCIDFKGRKYFISPEPMSFPAAQALALELKGHLLTISSAEENDFIAKQGRGLGLWMAAWRPADRTLAWRDERNRPLKYVTHWDVNQPDATGGMQWNSAVFTDRGTARWHDLESHWLGLHACIEWGEE